MSIGAFLRRERVTLARRGTAIFDRCAVVVLAALVVAGCAVAWDGWGWDRASVAGGARFALVTFAGVVASQLVLALGLVPAVVGPSIASERDRKSLDSLLATRLSASEIVLGKMGAGLLRYVNGLVALVPVVTLMVYLGGIDGRLVLLAALGVVSTAVALASLAVVVSAFARTASRAVSWSVAIAMMWMCLPQAVVVFLPRLWPSAAPWVVPVAVRVLDSSPLGLVLALSGVVPRGGPAVAFPRMVALQMAASAGLVLWAIARLRPASRAAHDAESRAMSRRYFRARWRPRPACGDDPVLWHELHTGRLVSGAAMWVGRLYFLFWIGLVVYGISWFVWPAFGELFRDGYGPAPGTAEVPEVNPIARVIVGKVMGLPADPAPGQARPELNHVSRVVTGCLNVLFVLMVAGAAAESVAGERERDTWLGLIATPLTGREILRAKMIGSIWKARWVGASMLVLWVVGLLAGAVHPLGFAAALGGLAVSGWFLAALGVFASLRSRDRAQAHARIIGPLLLLLSLAAVPFILPGPAGVVLAGCTMPFQSWASLFSYEDVRAMTHGGEIPQFAAIGLRGAWGARIILSAWLISTPAQAVGAFLLMRSAVRGFDQAVGRPILPRSGSGRP